MPNTMNFSSVFTIEKLNNVPQLDKYEGIQGNILDAFNFSTEEIPKKLRQDQICFTNGLSVHWRTNLLDL